MMITVNGENIMLKDESMTVAQLLEVRKVSGGGTAIALNGRICKADKWDVTRLNDGDDVMIITAAYGG